VKLTQDQIGTLLAQRREYDPDAQYWQQFLCEFHHGQREREMRKSGISGLALRFTRWISEMGITRFAYGVGLTYAGVTAAYLLTPPTIGRERLAPTPASYRVVPASTFQPGIQQMDSLDLAPSGEISVDEQVF
jgi:hypothetical protein